MKVLIIRFSSIGDIVLTTPVIRCIKKQIPGAEIHYLTKNSFREIVEYNPHLFKRHYLINDRSDIISDLKREKFDFIVDLQNNQRSWRLRVSLWRPSRGFNKLNIEKWLYVNARWNILPSLHIVDRYLETVRDLGVKNDGKGLEYFLAPTDEIGPDRLPLSHMHGYIAIVIGAYHNTKKLPVQKLKSLCKLLHYPLVLLGGKDDAKNGEEIRQTDPLKIWNACGKFSLNQSASLIKQSKLVITHDTGLMHIAAAFGKKIISVWGNTVPGFGMSPYYGQGSGETDRRSKKIEIDFLPCRPCSKIGYKKCPLGHFKCMNLIDEKAIADLVEKF